MVSRRHFRLSDNTPSNVSQKCTRLILIRAIGLNHPSSSIYSINCCRGILLQLHHITYEFNSGPAGLATPVVILRVITSGHGLSPPHSCSGFFLCAHLFSLLKVFSSDQRLEINQFILLKTGYKKQKGHHNVHNNKMQPQLPCDQEKSVVPNEVL